MQTNSGWGTWDVQHVNGVVYLESGLRVRLKVMDSRSGERKDTFDWQTDLKRLGPHSPLELGYARIDLTWKGESWSLEFGAADGRMVCLVQGEAASGLVFSVEFDAIWGFNIRIDPSPDGLLIRDDPGNHWLATASTAGSFLQSRDGSFQSDLSRPLIIEIRPERLAEGEPAVDFLERQKTLYEKDKLSSTGWLDGCADGLTRSIHWNTIWEPLKGRICTPVSREWCVNDFWGGYVLFDWDTFFCALMAGMESPELARDNIHAILDEITPQGFVPNFGAAKSTSLDRSQPPVGAYVVWKIWRASCLLEGKGDAGLLAETFDRLLVWHRWWMPHRDGNADGLLEWGSDLQVDPAAHENHTLRAAMYESGLDNSPMYDEAVFNPGANTMELADVGLNSLYALDAWALGEIAAVLGRETEARQLGEEYNGLVEKINRELWNEETGIYQNRFWDGRYSSSISPTNFYPLIAGVATPERAVRMVNEHLLNEAEFWGEFVLPSIARSDPGYRGREVIRDGISQPMADYWRGRIWAPMNFLVSEGLRRYEFDEVAHLFARKSVRLFLQEWNAENHVHENYNDLSGEGDDVPSANALYHWGALLAYLGIQELADREAWNGWRFGCLDAESASVAQIRLKEGLLSVAARQSGLSVCLDGRILLESDRVVILRGYHAEGNSVQFQVSGTADAVQLRVGPAASPRPGIPVHVRVGQETFQSLAASDGSAAMTIPLPSEVEVVWG